MKKTEKKHRILACLLTFVMLAGLLPATVLATGELPSGSYRKDGWAYTWDAGSKRLEISDNAAKVAAASDVPDISGMKDYAVEVAFVDGIKLQNGFEARYYIGANTTSLVMADVDTSGMTSMEHMFYECRSLINLDISGLDSENVTNMLGMFCFCSGLNNLDLSDLQTGKVIGMASMFTGTHSLTKLDLSGLDLSSADYCVNAFSGIESVKIIDLSGTNLGAGQPVAPLLFSNCTALKELNLSGCDLAKSVTNLDMFLQSDGLEIFHTPKSICGDFGGLPHEMYEDAPGDPLAMTTAYKNSIPYNTTIYRKNPVTYMNEAKDTELAKQNIRYGQDAKPELVTPPAKPGYSFAGWVDSSGAAAALTNIQAPQTVYASYKIENPDTAATSVTCPAITGVRGAAIASVTATRTGGTDGGKWSAAGLPAGLSINAVSGIISGTPTTAGSGAFTVTYTTPGGKATTSSKISYTIKEPGTGPDTAATSVTCPAITGVRGAAIASVTATRTGGTDGGKWSAAGLPAGLSIDAVSGIISGTPITAGSGTFTVTYTTPGGKGTTSAAIRYNIAGPEQQFSITFKVANGSWADGTTADKTVKIKAGGKLSAAMIPTGMKPDSGYGDGQWQPAQPDSNATVAADAVYTYAFRKGSSPGGDIGGGPGGEVTKRYTLTYETNGGPAIPAEQYEAGKLVPLDKSLSRAGYTFGGWFAEAACQNRLVQVTMDANKTVYAAWNKILTPPPSGFNYKEHFAYVLGYEDGLVHPDTEISRAQSATMLYRLLTTERRDAIFTADNGFTDVARNLWYNKAVSSMTKGGYIKGYTDGSFGGERNISRAEFVTMLVRFLGVDKTAVGTFVDVAQDYWAYGEIATATKAGWIAGYTDGSFQPDRSISRAEAMTILNRLLGRGVDKDSQISGHKVWPDNPESSWCYYEIIEATNDHEYTGTRPTENWTKLSVNHPYDIEHYERP